MKRQIASIALVPFILSGCGVSLETVNTSQPKAEVLQTTQQPVVLWDQTQSPQPAEFCKVPDQRPIEYLGQARGHTIDGVTWGGPSGFPLVEQTVPTQGELDWLIVMVAFKDTPKYVDEPSEFLDPQIEKLEAWAEFWSQGKLSFNVTYVNYWIDLPVNAIDRPKKDGDLANMIVQGMPDGMHPDHYDATFVQWANLAEAPGLAELNGTNNIRFTLRMGSNENTYESLNEVPKLFWAPGYYHSSDERQALTLKREFTYGHWLHEILHEMGLNLHAPGNGWATGVGQALYPNNQGWSAAINSWESFQLGWLDDSQVHCVDRESLESTKTILTPTDTYGGERKMIVVPTNNDSNEILVIEARQKGEWTDWADVSEGLLAYRVDPTAAHRDHVDNDCGNDPAIKKWAYYIYPDGTVSPEPNCGYFDLALIRVGETVTFDGMTVKLDATEEGLYYVSIKTN